MAEIVTPFASVQELQARWPDFPAGAEKHAAVLLEDASDFILDLVPAAVNARESTRRRVVCSVVKRALSTASGEGVSQSSWTQGPYTMSATAANPHGDFYLTRNERRALGEGRQIAFSVSAAPDFEERLHAWL